MTSRQDPLAGTRRVLVDGSNLVHALRRRSEALPAAALVGRIRAVFPPDVAVELIFDGPSERNLRGERIASGLTLRHGGARSADELIVEQVELAHRADGPEATAAILAVTDDRDLRLAVGRNGGRSAGTAWLIGRLERTRTGSPSIAPAKPPRGAGTGARPDGDGDSGGSGWSPGRGATTKRGNPRKSPKRDRT